MLVTGLSQEQEIRSQQLVLNRLIQRYERVIAREITRAMREAGRKLGDAMWQAEVRINHADKMTSILTRLWTQSGKDSSARLLAVAKSMPKYEKKFITTETVSRAIADWIRMFGGEKITQITKTTMLDINTIVSNGVEEGLGEREIGRLISGVAPSKSASRAQTIARTEAHGSSQGTSLAVANESDIEMEKVWIANGGERTRDDHWAANGQTVPMSGFFDVGGSRMEYPGDPSAPADQVINCRCVVGYEVV